MSAQSAHELKGLQSHRAKLEAEHAIRLQEQQSASRALQTVKDQMVAIDAKIRALQDSSAKVIVSEHAMLRYLERAKGIDMQAIHDEILDGREQTIKAMGSGKIKSGKLEFVIKNNTIVSVIG